jgi:hypothetical protein
MLPDDSPADQPPAELPAGVTTLGAVLDKLLSGRQDHRPEPIGRYPNSRLDGKFPRVPGPQPWNCGLDPERRYRRRLTADEPVTLGQLRAVVRRRDRKLIEAFAVHAARLSAIENLLYREGMV